MRTVQIYVNDIRLDLFQDEKIEVNSSVQNIQDISKVFTDFSQSFTVPASKVNNGVFSHYYNNDVNGTFLAKNRADARIEINHSLFRVGKIQLEGAEVKNNKAESYKITFFGDVVTLKDNFGEDKLQDLDYSTIQTTYNGANILASLTSTTDDNIRYPLISSNRIWDYDGGGVEDISVVGNPIVYDELFPAIKVSKIFELIASQYNLVFTGNFLSDTRFTNLFTWWKNRKQTDFSLEPIPIAFENNAEIMFTSSKVNIKQLKLAEYTPVGYDSTQTNPGIFKIDLFHSCDDVGADYQIEVYSKTAAQSTYILQFTNYNTVTAAGFQAELAIDSKYNDTGLDQLYFFRLRSTSGVTVYDVDIRVRHEFYAKLNPASVNVVFQNDTFCGLPSMENPYIISPYLDLINTAPDIKVADYFSGILSEFNLTCVPLQDGTAFEIEPLEDWYSRGGEVDITPYTIIDSIKIDRPKLYKKLSFDFEKSKSFLNEAFSSENGRDYGSLSSTFPYDGSEFKIKLPFENLYFNRFTDTELQVAYSTTEAVIDKGYIPKVCNLYLDESKDCSFYFNDGTTTTEITSYVPLGQDTVYNGENYSSNFGADTSTLKDVSINNSLYRTYYETYLSNLFNDKTRQVTLDCILPLSLLTKLTLDDLIILRDKKYRINTMKSELTSGMVTLNLLSDWSEDGTNYETFNVKAVGNTLIYPVNPIKPLQGGYVTVTDTSVETSFITTIPATPFTTTTSLNLQVIVAVNTTGLTRTNTLELEYYDASGSVIGLTVLTYIQDFERNYLLNEDAGTIGFDGKILTELFDGILL